MKLLNPWWIHFFKWFQASCVKDGFEGLSMVVSSWEKTNASCGTCVRWCYACKEFVFLLQMWNVQEGFDNFNGFRWHLFNMSRVYHAKNHPTCFGLLSISTMANDWFVCWISILNTKPTQYLSFAPPKQRCASKSTQTSRIFKSYFSFRSQSPLFSIFTYIYIFTYTYTYCFLFFFAARKNSVLRWRIIQVKPVLRLSHN